MTERATTQPASPTRASLASSEDMDVVFVLVDRYAPTARSARLVLLKYAPVDWGERVDAAEVGEPDERRWYKWDDAHGEDVLVVCEADDPARDSEWWLFTHIAPGSWESV